MIFPEVSNVQIGKGSFGKVFIGKKNNALYAVKLIREINYDAEMESTMMREIIASTTITPHPHLLQASSMALCYGTASHCVLPLDAYLMMPLMKTPLSKYIIKVYPDGMPIPQLMVAARQLISVIEHLHEQGFTYCDLTPDNILVDENGNLFVADMGSIRYRVDTDELMCTCITRSPEEVIGSSLDNRMDLWSLGIVLIFMAIGLRGIDVTSVGERFSHEMRTIFNKCSVDVRYFIGMVSRLNFPTISEWPEGWESIDKCGMKQFIEAIRPTTVRELLSTEIPESFVTVVEKLLQWRPYDRISATNALIALDAMDTADDATDVMIDTMDTVVDIITDTASRIPPSAIWTSLDTKVAFNLNPHNRYGPHLSTVDVKTLQKMRVWLVGIGIKHHVTAATILNSFELMDRYYSHVVEDDLHPYLLGIACLYLVSHVFENKQPKDLISNIVGFTDDDLYSAKITVLHVVEGCIVLPFDESRCTPLLEIAIDIATIEKCGMLGFWPSFAAKDDIITV